MVLYPEPSQNITTLLDFWKYANEVSFQNLFTPMILLGTFLIILFAQQSGFNIEFKHKFAVAGAITGLLSAILWMGGLLTFKILAIGALIYFVSFIIVNSVRKE